MLAEHIAAHDDVPVDDHIVLLRDAAWSDYQRILELRGDRSVPKLAYLNGVLELMSPSRTHESLKSLIGRLVEVWCLERGVEFSPYGSWTLESKETDRGVEPDECYVFGEQRDLARRVDMAGSNYARIEAGRYVPSRVALLRLASALGCTLGEIVGPQYP